MNSLQALGVLRRAVAESNQEDVADEIGVAKSTVSRWLSSGASPRGKRVKLLKAWAARQPADPLLDIVTQAVAETGRNISRLAEIRTYARVVLEQLQDAAKRQELVVSALEPWSDAEGRHAAARLLQQLTDSPEAAKLRAELDAASADVPDVTPPAETPVAAPVRRRAKGQG